MSTVPRRGLYTGKPEGLGWRARVGLIVPANNTVIEPEIHRLDLAGVTFHAARVIGSRGDEASIDGLRAITQGVREAVDALAIADVDVMIYACLSTSLVNEGWEATFADHVRASARATPFTALEATLGAVARRGAHTVSIVTPYGSRIQATVPAAFEAAGIEVRALHSLDLPGLRQVCRVPPSTVFASMVALEISLLDADAIVILATDLQTLEALAPLREHWNVDVISTNAAIAEHLGMIIS